MKIGEAELSEAYLRYHIQRTFWKQSKFLTTYPQCEEATELVMNALLNLAEWPEHYTGVSKDFDTILGDDDGTID